jgi:hypothetical protein
MARMPKILRQLLQNDQNDEQVAAQEEAEQNRQAREDSTSDSDRAREDDSGRAFWETMAGAGETSESSQSAERVETEARTDGDAGEPQGAEAELLDSQAVEEQAMAAAEQELAAGDTVQTDGATARQGVRSNGNANAQGNGNANGQNGNQGNGNGNAEASESESTTEQAAAATER